MIPARGVTVVLIAATLGLSACGGAASTAPDPAAQALAFRQELLQPGPLGERDYGNPNAPVTIIEYASLTCPHCRNYHAKVFPKVKRAFIDTGKVHYIIREFPIGHTAGKAAIVTRCVPKNKYLPLVTAFLARQPEWVSQEVRPDAIYKVAKSSGMSRAEFDKCLSNQAIIDGLTEVKQRGRKYGVIGTPTLFINGKKIQGEVSFEEVKALIAPQAS
jgi:protein-disulfide isomerase